MKTRATSTFFVLLAIAALVTTVPSAFADHTEVTVKVASGANTPGCEESADGCYLPKEVTVDVGGKVIFSNTDTAAHTFTAGTPADGPSGEFDSGLVMAGSTFEAKLEKEGTVGYFCMVHPWMVGSIVVQAAGAEEPSHGTDNMGAEDLMVEINTKEVAAGEPMPIDVTFKTMAGAAVEHVNYSITATQDGKEVLNEATVHTHNGVDTKMTAPLPNGASGDHPVDVQVKFLGFGLPGEEAKWSGPIGQIATKKVVPEFGTVAMMILGIAIVSIIAISTKSRVIPRI